MSFFNYVIILSPLMLICCFHIYTKQFVWKIGIIGSCFNLGGALIYWLCFDTLSLSFQFYSEFVINVISPQSFGYLENHLSELIFALDGLSLVFLLLTKMIFVCCIYYSMYTVTYNTRGYVTILFLIDFCLSASFLTINLFLFYIFFESLLIPMYLLIGIWGGRARKIRAAYFLVMYTVVFSFFLLFALFFIYLWYGTYNFFLLNYFIKLQIITISFVKEIFLWAFFFIAFAAKLPIFPFHIWLPEAHVEAPTVGSVILASLLLKLGGYGIVRFLLLSLSFDANYYFLNIYATIAVISCIYTTFIAARQVDIKKIIAYSSIAHMNLTLLGLFSNSTIGIAGSVSLMLAHGFVSGALFFSMGMLYSRFNTRLLKYYSGVTAIVPKLSIFFLFFSFANIGFPGTYNFLGELWILLGLFLNTLVGVGLLIGISFVCSLVYSIWVFNKIFFGGFSAYLEHARDISFFEILILVWLSGCTLYFGINPYLINEILLPTLEKI